MEAKQRIEEALSPLVEVLAGLGVSPHLLSLLSLLAAAAAGAAFYLGSFAAAALLVAANALMDALDGALARRLGEEGPRGDLLDHTVDRFADVAMIAGLAFAPGTSLRLGIFAVAGVLLTSYMGTQAQAVGAGRVYAGILGRAYRLILLIAAASAAALLPTHSATLLNGLLAFFGVLGTYTALHRFYGTWRNLE